MGDLNPIGVFDGILSLVKRKGIHWIRLFALANIDCDKLVAVGGPLHSAITRRPRLSENLEKIKSKAQEIIIEKNPGGRRFHNFLQANYDVHCWTPLPNDWSIRGINAVSDFVGNMVPNPFGAVR